MLGSVFSPFYAKARAAKTPAKALEHCSMNVALYAKNRHLWAMTERSSSAIAREKSALSIGPSTMEVRGDELIVRFDEITSPFPSPFSERLCGSVHIRTQGFTPHAFALDEAQKHRWTPLAPDARAEVRLSHPGLCFQGHAYVDANAGSEALEQAFCRWSWSRASHEGGASVTYDIERLDGSRKLIAKRFGPQGEMEDLPPLAPANLGLTRWGLSRDIMVDRQSRPRLLRTLEDTPFYSRSMARASFGGKSGPLVHETLCLKRFTKPWVQHLLPYRMKKAGQCP